jgi:hypothetical protein
MAQRIQYCRCKINLSGQNCHTVHFTEYDPVSWPEVQVLMLLHGEENVMDIVPVGIGEVYPTNEKNRLAAIYGSRPVEACFPGRSFRMEYMMTEDIDLPFYVDGRMAKPGQHPQEPAPMPDPPPQPPVKSPPPLDSPGTDHDNGEDDDTPSDKAALPSLDPPVFKPGRNRPGSRPSV